MNWIQKALYRRKARKELVEKEDQKEQLLLKQEEDKKRMRKKVEEEGAAAMKILESAETIPPNYRELLQKINKAESVRRAK